MTIKTDAPAVEVSSSPLHDFPDRKQYECGEGATKAIAYSTPEGGLECTIYMRMRWDLSGLGEVNVAMVRRAVAAEFFGNGRDYDHYREEWIDNYTAILAHHYGADSCPSLRRVPNDTEYR